MREETLEEHLETVIDELCNRIQERVYDCISAESWEEQRQASMGMQV